MQVCVCNWYCWVLIFTASDHFWCVPCIHWEQVDSKRMSSHFRSLRWHGSRYVALIYMDEITFHKQNSVKAIETNLYYTIFFGTGLNKLKFYKILTKIYLNSNTYVLLLRLKVIVFWTYIMCSWLASCWQLQSVLDLQWLMK